MFFFFLKKEKTHCTFFKGNILTHLFLLRLRKETTQPTETCMLLIICSSITSKINCEIFPTAALIQTKCQLESAPGAGKIGAYKPQCDEQGRYKPMQCWHATGFCWCVDESGNPIEGTTMRGRPDCRRGTGHRWNVLWNDVLLKFVVKSDKPRLTFSFSFLSFSGLAPRRVMMAPRMMQRAVLPDGEILR